MNQTLRRSAGLFFMMVGIGFSLAPQTAIAQDQDPDIQIENIRIGFSDNEANQFYKLGTWTPVRVDLQAGAETYQGFIRIRCSDDGGVPTDTYRRVEVPARTTQPFLCYMRPGDAIEGLQVDVFDDRNGRPGRRPRTGTSDIGPEVLDPQVQVVATIGEAVGIAGLVDRSEFQPSDEQRGNFLNAQSLLYVTSVRIPEGIPDQWYGYDGVDVLVLNTNDRAALDSLQDFRNLSLIDWIRRGGHLVVTIGDNAQIAADEDGFLRQLLPAIPAGQTDASSDPGAIESFSGSPTGIPTDGPGRLEVTHFELRPGRAPTPLLDDRSLGGPVIVRGHYGLGLVTVVGLNVDQRPFIDWEGNQDFWIEVLNLTTQDELRLARNFGNNPFYGDELRDLSSYLNRSLEQFAGVKLVPFGWVAFFVFLYILLIGPGDYFFLKRVLKRMELTWITFPTIVISVSLIAYIAAYSIKGTDLRLNRIDIVDIDQASAVGSERFLTRGASFTTIFSPQNRDYNISIAPLPIESADPKADGPMARTDVDQIITSWFGKAEASFGSMGRSSGIGLTNSGYRYANSNDETTSEPPEELVGVRVPIWTTKAFQSFWFGSSPAVVETELSAAGAGLDGTITNRLGRPISQAAVVFGNEIYLFDRERIAPGETIRIEDGERRLLSTYLNELNQRANNAYARNTGTDIGITRPNLVRALSFPKAASRDRVDVRSNLVLNDLELSDQLALGRPILLLTIDESSTSFLINDKEPQAGQVSESTVVRVLLPAIAP